MESEVVTRLGERVSRLMDEIATANGRLGNLTLEMAVLQEKVGGIKENKKGLDIVERRVSTLELKGAKLMGMLAAASTIASGISIGAMELIKILGAG